MCLPKYVFSFFLNLNRIEKKKRTEKEIKFRITNDCFSYMKKMNDGISSLFLFDVQKRSEFLEKIKKLDFFQSINDKIKKKERILILRNYFQLIWKNYFFFIHH